MEVVVNAMWTLLIIVFVVLAVFSAEFRRRLFNFFAEVAARYVALVISLLVIGAIFRHMAAATGLPFH